MKSHILLGDFTITAEQTEQFAQLSGDFNPLHVDPVAARRLRFGHTVIHGVNGTIAALDLLFKYLGEPAQLVNLSVNYAKPVKQGDVLTVVYVQDTPSKGKLEVLIKGKKAQVIKVEYANNQLLNSINGCLATHQPPIELHIDQAEKLQESFDLHWDDEVAKHLFPSLMVSIPHPQICFLMGLTNIVGMRCPGLHSVFAGLKVTFDNYDVPDTSMSYSVDLADKRFSRVLMTAKNNVGQSQVEALFREPLVQQPSYDFVKSQVKSGMFSGYKALIVGGSRGLGEIVSKAIAAGGGEVTIGYAYGEADAKSIQLEIQRSGGSASILQTNVLDLNDAAKQVLDDVHFSHLYYFASPLIEKNDELFDPALFAKFCEYYVAGMANIVNQIAQNKARRKDNVSLFIPSTVFINESKKGFSEYIAAKLAAETYAKQQVASFPGWKVVMPRLQPMLTDQTASVVSMTPEENFQQVLQLLVNEPEAE